MSERPVTTGHNGPYLAEFLDTQGYEILGIVRRSTVAICDPISHLVEKHP